MALKLNLGCGFDKREGYVNVDLAYRCAPDQCWDVQGHWPLPSASVGECLARHVVEHLGDLRTFFTEAYRVIYAGGLLDIHVPHERSDGFLGDPTHKTPITYGMMTLLSRAKNDEFIAKGWPNTPLALYWGVDFEIEKVEFDLQPHWQAKNLPRETIDYAILTYANVVNEVRFRLRRV